VLAATCLAAGIGAATSAMATDTLIVNQYIKPNQYLASADGSHRLIFQPDGNLVLQRQSDMTQLWSTNTGGQNGQRLMLGADGNLTVQTYGKAAAWTSNTRGNRVSRLTLRNDGNLVMVDTANKEVWATRTTSRQVSTLAGSVSYVGATSTYTSAGTTITIDRPATTAINDLIIAVVQTATAAIPTTAPSGWTRLASCNVSANNATACDGGSDMGAVIFYRIAGAAGAGSYTFSKPNNQFTAAAIMVLRNVNTSDPFRVVSSTNSARYKVVLDDGTNQSNTCPTYAGVTGGHAVCVFVHDDAQLMSFNNGFTNRRSVVRSDSALYLVSKGLSNTDATGGTVGTYTEEDPLNQPGNGIQFAFVVKPSP
jgi:hypothetical protein